MIYLITLKVQSIIILFDCLELRKLTPKLSDNKFDPTIMPYVDVWNHMQKLCLKIFELII
jgi:thiamine biosynthesis lipoprotein ApbE